MQWIATNPCATCGGEGRVGGIGGRPVECNECAGEGGGSQWVATTKGPLVILVNRCEDGNWRCKLMFGRDVSRSERFVGTYHPIGRTGGGVGYLEAAYGDLPSAQREAERAVGLMLVRVGEGAAV